MRLRMVGGCMLWRHCNKLKTKIKGSKRQKSVFTVRDVALKCANLVSEIAKKQGFCCRTGWEHTYA